MSSRFGRHYRSIVPMLMTYLLSTSLSYGAEVKVVGITVGSLGNPYYVATDRGITIQANEITPHAKLTFVSADYDLAKQFSQIDSFIGAGAQIIMLAAADPNAIAPAVKRAQAAGIVVGAFDSAAKDADFTITTDNIEAGRQACQYIVDHLPADRGDVIILNGPQVSPIRDRVNGCKAVIAQHPGVKLLSADIDAHASRDGGLTVGQDLLARYQHIDAVFAVNDQSAIGLTLAAHQLHRTDFFITCVDGSPDIVTELKEKNGLVRASAAQDPARMAFVAYRMAVDLVEGRTLKSRSVLLPPRLVTSDNVADYPGWNDPSIGLK